MHFRLRTLALAVVADLVVAAARTSSDFDSVPFRWPALFVMSAEDGCTVTSAAGNEALCQRFKERKAAPTEFVLVRSAQPETGDPCRTGAHMHHRAEEETAKIPDDFIVRHKSLLAAPR
jgi:hypothetical protein